MHDIDRTSLETGWETGAYGEGEYGYEVDRGGYGQEYGQYEMFPEISGEVYGEATLESPFTEAEEAELAAELLEIGTEEELDQFIGKLFKKAGRFFKSGVGRTLGGALKGIAKRLVPMAGAALGNILLPGVGGVVGGKLASMAGKAFGLEFEGMSAEDQEYEVARRFVRLAGAAAQNAAAAPPNAPPQAVAQRAIAAAARQHAPGLVARASQQVRQFRGQRGAWVRHGRTIVLLGV
ncbi:MAG: hypothetical protein HYX92_02195 [Chloroflexi bacterium]|nr:hypothetical protein [Chloroflexota bacterium]